MRLEKILSKKFVRGKPYYKVRWQGSGDAQPTWETPPSLERYRSMINNYEIKNWGVPLQDKYFDAEIYANKGFADRSKQFSKKIAKQAKKRARGVSQKQIEGFSDSQSEQIEHETATREVLPQQQQNKRNAKPNEQKVKTSRHRNSRDVQIVNLSSENDQSSDGASGDQLPRNLNLIEISKEKRQNTSPNSQRNVQENSIRQQPSLSSEESSGLNTDLGLIIPSDPLSVSEERSPFTITRTLCLSIGGSEKRITKIYHLEGLVEGAHLYLVEYSDRSLKKHSSDYLVEHHTEDFIKYLESEVKRREEQRGKL